METVAPEASLDSPSRRAPGIEIAVSWPGSVARKVSRSLGPAALATVLGSERAIVSATSSIVEVASAVTMMSSTTPSGRDSANFSRTVLPVCSLIRVGWWSNVIE